LKQSKTTAFALFFWGCWLMFVASYASKIFQILFSIIGLSFIFIFISALEINGEQRWNPPQKTYKHTLHVDNFLSMDAYCRVLEVDGIQKYAGKDVLVTSKEKDFPMYIRLPKSNNLIYISYGAGRFFTIIKTS